MPSTHCDVQSLLLLLWEAQLLLLHLATFSPSKSLLSGRKYWLGISVWKSGPVIQKLTEIITAVPACIKVHYSKPLGPPLFPSLNSCITYQKRKAHHV